MANNYKHTRTITDTIKIKGTVCADDSRIYITYEKDKDEYTMDINDVFNQYLGETVNVLISTKDEVDLDE